MSRSVIVPLTDEVETQKPLGTSGATTNTHPNSRLDNAASEDGRCIHFLPMLHTLRRKERRVRMTWTALPISLLVAFRL